MTILYCYFFILLQPLTAEEIKSMREKIIEKRKSIYTDTEGHVSKRWNFEEGV